MSFLGRFFAGDEELGKKDDDHRPRKNGIAPMWAPTKPAPFLRRRRLIYAIVGFLILYAFYRNIPTDLGPHSGSEFSTRTGRPSYGTPDPPPDPPQQRKGQSKQPESGEEQQHYYEGPIKFYKLAVSLHEVANLAGDQGANKNVLWAASSLKSASEMIPMACEMAAWGRNDVHFAIMGREDMEMDEIKKINGVSDDCKMYWHG